MESLSHSEIAQMRLDHLGLTRASVATPEAIVSRLVAVQAQDYYGATWALGIRIQGAVEAQIDQAFDEGRILRTHILRPTWHFVTPADIRWMLALTAKRVHQMNGSMYRKLELDETVFKRCHRSLEKALSGGKYLTRDELGRVLESDGLDHCNGQRLAYLMMHAELEGLICSGPRRGKQFTYGLLAERSPAGSLPARDEALAELARRFIMSRSPATAYDFAKWSGLTVTESKAGFEALRTAFERTQVDGEVYWHTGRKVMQTSETAPALLLSIFDEWVSSYKHQNAMVEPDILERLISMDNALRNIIVVQGRIVGVWRRTLKNDSVLVETEIFQPVSEKIRQLIIKAARRYAGFLNRALVLNERLELELEDEKEAGTSLSMDSQ